MTRSEAAPIRVLHVDDEPDFADMAATFLERTDGRLTVETASNADEGMERLEVGGFDCVVSDYEMPGRDGIAFLEAVREENSDLPFLLYTGEGSEGVASDAISAGATDYLQKSVGTDQFTILANRIRNAVEQYRATRRAAELDRVRALVSTVNQALVRADSRSAVETRVCEIFSDADPYRFAWIGDVDSDTGVITPRASAGIDEGYLEEVTVTSDGTRTGRGPGGTAVRERRVSVSQNVQEDPDFEPWRDDALERGFQAVAAIPLDHDDTLYGILCVYADRPEAFDEVERGLLAELGDDTAHAIHSLEIQSQLREERKRLERSERILEVSGDPVYALDSDGRLTYVNDALVDLTGYTESELVGEHISIIVDRSDVDRGTAVITDLLRSDERTRATFEMELVTADGDAVACENHIALLPSEDGFAGTTGIVRDITERKQREQELEQEKNRLEEFTTVVSHDLRNPLNVAEGRVELARDECDSDHLDAASDAFDRMRELIDDLLSLARSGDRIDATTPIDLGSLVERCWRNVDVTDAAIVIDTERTIRADRSRLGQLFENLFRNSIEHVGSDVTVTVGDLSDGFYVEDDGPGISDDDRDVVFEVGHSTTEGGTGFGLSIVKQVTNAHGWSVQVTDGSDGGARFEITAVEVVDE